MLKVMAQVLLQTLLMYHCCDHYLQPDDRTEDHAESNVVSEVIKVFNNCPSRE